MSKNKIILLSILGFILIAYGIFFINIPSLSKNFFLDQLENITAHLGLPESQFQRGLKYKTGTLFVEKSPEKEFIWFKKAADNGHLHAQINTGYCFEYGEGVEKNYVEALKWYRKSQSHPIAKANIANFYVRGLGGLNKDHTKALELYKEAALLDFAPAAEQVGLAYESGDGVPKDNEQARKWYMIAADKNLPQRQFFVGRTYMNDIPPNYSQAQKWFTKAAEQGEMYSLGSLGYLFQWGLGVPQNFDKAAVYYRESINKGNKDAQKHLEQVELMKLMAPRPSNLTAP